MKLKPGDHVRYRETHHGPAVGVCEDEWKSWFACKSCHEEIDGNSQSCPLCGFGGNPNLARAWDELGPISLRVSGDDIWRVRFGDEIRFINKCWLRKA